MLERITPMESDIGDILRQKLGQQVKQPRVLSTEIRSLIAEFGAASIIKETLAQAHASAKNAADASEKAHEALTAAREACGGAA